MMALSILRFWWNGWIEKLYLEPTFFFSYRYFEWVKPPGEWTYLIFGIAFLSALMLMLGWKYRLAAIAFFLSFTCIELMDKTTYLNHYYFVSLLSFVLIWLPAADYFSVDKGADKTVTVPRWTINCLKVFVGVVYFYAGLAKLNSDWLIDAQPLAIWLPAKYDIPLLGSLMQQLWVHYAFSWAGAAYDLFIVFFLLWRPARPFAFAAVVIFHVLTRVLFPIGMFPYIMIVNALIFFDARFHQRLLDLLKFRPFSSTPKSALPASSSKTATSASPPTPVSPASSSNTATSTSPPTPVSPASSSKTATSTSPPTPVSPASSSKTATSASPPTPVSPAMSSKTATSASPTTPDYPLPTTHYPLNKAQPQVQRKFTVSKVVVYTVLALHLILPWRYLMYPGELFWTEEGYRFSWRVMLMEKAGYLTYKIEDPATGKRSTIDPAAYLTTFQNKQLATQPDFILEFAHHLASLHQQKDGSLPAVYAESYVALNGRGSQVYVDPEANLTKITEDTPRTEWLMPFEDAIYGL